MTTTSQDSGTDVIARDSSCAGAPFSPVPSLPQFFHDQVPQRARRLEVFEEDLVGRYRNREGLLDERDQSEDAQRVDQAFGNDVGIGPHRVGSVPARSFLRKKFSK